MRLRPVTPLTAIALVAMATAACGGGNSAGNATSTSSSTTLRQPTTAPSAQVGALQLTTASWKLSAPIANEVLFSDGSHVTILGGLDSTKFSTSAVVRVNPTTGASQPVGALAQAVHDSAGVIAGNAILVIGGGGPSENGSAAVQRVDTTGHTTIVGQMPQPRSDHVAAAVGGKIYVLGGYDGARIVSDVVASTNGASFTKVATLPVPVRYPALAVIGKAIYLFGGVASTRGADTTAIQRLDTTTGQVETIGQLPTTLSHASALTLGGQVYLLGGYINNTQLSSQILRFDPATASTSIAGQLPEPNSDAAAVTINGHGYLVGGKSTARDPLDTVLRLSLQERPSSRSTSR
jgi:N-acetylneuraminic acid mutarotase